MDRWTTLIVYSWQVGCLYKPIRKSLEIGTILLVPSVFAVAPMSGCRTTFPESEHYWPRAALVLLRLSDDGKRDCVSEKFSFSHDPYGPTSILVRGPLRAFQRDRRFFFY